MVNMNKFKQPAVYAITSLVSGDTLYIGFTTTNALNRFWQHKYRATSGHNAPIYKEMRRLGVENTSFTVIQFVDKVSEGKVIEAKTIKAMIDSGRKLFNELSRDGVVDSLPEHLKQKMSKERKNKDTWIKGKRGVEAGWTKERKKGSVRSIKTSSSVPVQKAATEYDIWS